MGKHLTYVEFKQSYPDSTLTEVEFNELYELSDLIFNYIGVTTDIEYVVTTDCLRSAYKLQVKYLSNNPKVLDSESAMYKSFSITNFSATLNDSYDSIQALLDRFAYMKLYNCGYITSIAQAGRSCGIC